MSATSRTSLGVDVGGTSVKVALLEGDRPAWTGQSPFYSRPNADELKQAIRAAAGGRTVRVEVTGICVPGLLTHDRSRVKLSVNVPGLNGLPLDELVHEALGIDAGKVHVINDAAASSTDYARLHGLTGRLLAIALGTGVGGAVLDDGVMLRVEGASSGHLGQMDVSLDDEPAVLGPDGGAGSVEGYLGVPALKQRYGENLNDAISRWTERDPPMRALARTIRICHAIYRPLHVVLLGGIGVRLKPVLPVLDRMVRRHLTSVADPKWTLVCGDDDFHAARGAARLASEQG
mgnify:CR=1 FL=1